MRLIVGLGNPGEEYERTRHNLGFILLDELAEKLDATDWKAFKGGEVAEVRLAGEKHLLFRPMQYMNKSGHPIRQLVDYYDIPLENVCIAADDVYLMPGDARVRRSGADGGHNGWKSVIEHLGDGGYIRVRLGAGLYEQDPQKRRHQPPLDAYVLQPMPKHDEHRAGQLIDMMVPNLVRWLGTGELSEETFHAI